MFTRGICTSLVTPFTQDGAIDEAGMRQQIDRSLEAGVHAVCVLGGTGEPLAISIAERDRLLADERADCRACPSSGAFAVDPNEAVAIGRSAKRAGADALMVMAPLLQPGIARRCARELRGDRAGQICPSSSSTRR